MLNQRLLYSALYIATGRDVGSLTDVRSAIWTTVADLRWRVRFGLARLVDLPKRLGHEAYPVGKSAQIRHEVRATQNEAKGFYDGSQSDE